MQGDTFFDFVDRTTLAYFLVVGLVVTIVVMGGRSIRAHRLEMKRRAGAGPRSQFEKRRHG
jgi:hypothetical protein